MARDVLTAAPRTRVPIDKIVQNCPFNKSASWPWLTFRGHFTVTNVKIAYDFLMVRNKHVVTMKHYWEVDIGLSESAKKFDLGWPWTGHFKVTKMKIAYGVSSVKDGSKLAIGRILCSFDDLDRGKDWFGGMSRPSQQQLGFLLLDKCYHNSNIVLFYHNCCDLQLAISDVI